AARPRVREVERSGCGNSGSGGSEWRILLIALSREEVGFIVDERPADTKDRFAIAVGVECQAEARRELPDRILSESFGNALISVVEDTGGRVGIDGAVGIVQE